MKWNIDFTKKMGIWEWLFGVTTIGLSAIGLIWLMTAPSQSSHQEEGVAALDSEFHSLATENSPVESKALQDEFDNKDGFTNGRLHIAKRDQSQALSMPENKKILVLPLAYAQLPSEYSPTLLESVSSTGQSKLRSCLLGIDGVDVAIKEVRRLRLQEFEYSKTAMVARELAYGKEKAAGYLLVPVIQTLSAHTHTYDKEIFIKTRRASMSVAISIIHVESGRDIFAKDYSGQAKGQLCEGENTNQKDLQLYRQVFEQIIEQAEADLKRALM